MFLGVEIEQMMAGWRAYLRIQRFKTKNQMATRASTRASTRACKR
jgi:hypothetical protein